MAQTYNKFQQFVEDIANEVHNLGSDQLVVALTNSAPTATDAVLTDLTQVSYTNCSTRNITTTSSEQTTGTYKLILVDLVLTASGDVGPFRYVTIYNDDSASDSLIGYFDYESSITLHSGDTFTVDFSATDGLLQLA